MNAARDFLIGCAGVLGVNVLAALAIMILASEGLEPAGGALVTLGLVQLLWVVPGVIWANRIGRKTLGKGIVLGAVLVLLLNGGCFVFVLMNPSTGVSH